MSSPRLYTDIDLKASEAHKLKLPARRQGFGETLAVTPGYQNRHVTGCSSVHEKEMAFSGQDKGPWPDRRIHISQTPRRAMLHDVPHLGKIGLILVKDKRQKKQLIRNVAQRDPSGAIKSPEAKVSGADSPEAPTWTPRGSIVCWRLANVAILYQADGVLPRSDS
ncbi:hypothetical protein NM208_g14294 [Fusarium decemcellulare]|uniref:Uncharacterized protein n=1 Tax=Fusarium decemcellulare TaxID=57161 RepID=A0ACC1RHT3_9HYPO|nr:hypothetical protein NM208_g14294 [Fusarium decemcellulare]